MTVHGEIRNADECKLRLELYISILDSDRPDGGLAESSALSAALGDAGSWLFLGVHVFVFYRLVFAF